MEQIQKILKKAQEEGVNNTREFESLEWYYKKVRSTKIKTNPKDFIEEKGRFSVKFIPGRMYHFSYLT